VDAFDLVPPVVWHGEAIADCDPLDHENAVALEDLAGGLDFVALRVDFDLTRLQRAGEGARQSAARRGYHVVERRRTRWKLVRPNAVMLGDLGVHSEGDRILLGREVGESLGSAEPLDLHH
jgi:hypothetical protein